MYLRPKRLVERESMEILENGKEFHEIVSKKPQTSQEDSALHTWWDINMQ